MSRQITLRGVIKFVGITTNEKGKKHESLSLYLTKEEGQKYLDIYESLKKAYKKFKHSLAPAYDETKGTEDKPRLIDFPLDQYVYKLNMKTEVGRGEYKNISGQKLSLVRMDGKQSDLFTGDEVAVKITISPREYTPTNTWHCTAFIQTCVLLKKEKYKYSGASAPEEDIQKSNKDLDDIISSILEEAGSDDGDEIEL